MGDEQTSFFDLEPNDSTKEMIACRALEENTTIAEALEQIVSEWEVNKREVEYLKRRRRFDERELLQELEDLIARNERMTAIFNLLHVKHTAILDSSKTNQKQ